MEYVRLGRRGIVASRLCFGSLTVSSLQAALPEERGAEVVAYALERGVSFIDTAQYYDNYGIIRGALRRSGKYDTVISSKTYAFEAAAAEEAVEQARRGLDRDYIDIFMLHEQESADTLRGHRAAYERLLELRERGVIRAVGVSMHRVAAVTAACRLLDLPDVIHPLFNMGGLGIPDGSADDMRRALDAAHGAGVGVFSMKALGGGHYYNRAGEAFDFVLDCGAVDAVAVGMQSEDEVDANISYFSSRDFPDGTERRLRDVGRRLCVEEDCIGCGRCEERCPCKAIHVTDGRAVCNHEKCLLCGYCAGVCPQFAIKLI